MSCLRLFVYTQVRFNHSWIKPNGYDTGIKVYNCITKGKVPFIVKNPHLVTWYTCGPTVYDSAHIGHASCFVKLDIIQRILKYYFKINLITAMNITDIDDKIIKKCIGSGQSPQEISKHYENEFWKDISDLKITKPNLILRVTENMKTIEKFVAVLTENQHAYFDENGSIIFNRNTDQVYGKLQNIKQTDSDTADFNSKSNFTLWKKAKQDEPFWNSTFGPGRPGWHTECSALASSVFGSAIDIHAGGIDLRFPHHENEEVQCCAYFSKKQWVNYWFHTGHLLQNSTKMSKSLKNTITISNMLENCSADVFRIMCLMTHYRNNMEYNNAYVKSAESLLKSYRDFVHNCNACINGKVKVRFDGSVLYKSLLETIDNVHNALLDDFDTASCIKTINSLISDVNKMLHGNIEEESSLNEMVPVIAIRNFLTNFFKMFEIHLSSDTVTDSTNEYTDINGIIDVLTEFRQDVRLLSIANKNKELLGLCDNVRHNLKQFGITIKDHGKASTWSK